MKCRYCTVYWNTSSHRVSEACHVLPIICLPLQGLRTCFRWSEVSHAFPILLLPGHNLLMRFTSSLSSLTHTIRIHSIFSIIWYLYIPFVWEIMATITMQHPYADYSTALRTCLSSGEWYHVVEANVQWRRYASALYPYAPNTMA